MIYISYSSQIKINHKCRLQLFLQTHHIPPPSFPTLLSQPFPILLNRYYKAEILPIKPYTNPPLLNFITLCLPTPSHPTFPSPRGLHLRVLGRIPPYLYQYLQCKYINVGLHYTIFKMYIHHRNTAYRITKGIHLTSFFKQTKKERLLQGMLKVQSSIKYKNASHSEIFLKLNFS